MFEMEVTHTPAFIQKEIVLVVSCPEISSLLLGPETHSHSSFSASELNSLSSMHISLAVIAPFWYTIDQSDCTWIQNSISTGQVTGELFSHRSSAFLYAGA